MASESLLDGRRILIVDDEPDILEILKDLLSMRDVIQAHTFNEARELLETQYFNKKFGPDWQKRHGITMR